MVYVFMWCVWYRCGMCCALYVCLCVYGMCVHVFVICVVYVHTHTHVDTHRSVCVYVCGGLWLMLGIFLNPSLLYSLV